MRKLKALPVSHLEKLIRENKPIYVVNSSALPSGDKGMVIINFFDGTRREFFKMPPTFIPMAVTDSISPNKILDSKDFRQSLLKGMLTLIEPTSAEAYLATREAQDEYESLVLSELSAKSQKLDINRSVTSRKAVHHSSHEGGGPIQDVTAVDTVSNKVRGIVESLLAGTLTSKEALIQLRRHQSALHSVDFSYVVANTADQELKKWAKNGLNRTTKEEFLDDEENEEESEDEYEDEDEEEEDEDEDDVAKPTKIKKNRGRPKGSVGKKGSEGKTKKDNNYANIFDFKNESVEEMTDEERSLDERARSVAMNQQAVGQQSMYQQEINKILSGGPKE